MVKFQQLAAIALVFVIGGITLGIGSQILADMRSKLDGGESDNNANATINETMIGLLELAGWMPTIGLVIAAAIIIGVIFSAFTPGRGGV